MMKKFIVRLTAIPAVALMVEVTLAFPCARSGRNGDFNGDGFVNMLGFANWG